MSFTRYLPFYLLITDNLNELSIFNLPSLYSACSFRRNFTTAGAAAGVSAAFAAPVGGLLFAMEEVSSFWSLKLGWMTFFCSMLATFTCDLFNSSFHEFHFDGMFGLFKTDKYIIFKASTQNV